MGSEVRHFYEFGPFRLDAERHRLSRGGEVVPLAPKDAETLLVLVRHAGRMLEREELMRAVWAGSFVEDANLTVAVSHLRKALGQDGGEYIETIPRVGYRFVADVREVREEPAPLPAALVVEKHTLSQTVIEEEFVNDEPGKAALAASAAVEPAVAPPAASANALPAAANAPSTAKPPKRVFAILAGAALTALASAGLLAYRGYNSERRALTVGSVRSVAVLPLRALNAPEEDAYLGLGIADNLVSRLGGQRRLVVRPLSAVAKYDGNREEAAEVARSLQVDAVFEGDFQRVGDRVRIFIQLVGARDGAVLWARTFDQNRSDALALQDAIAEQTAGALVPDLSGDERRQRARRPTENAEAYALYLKGRYFWNKRGDNVAKAIEYFRQAVALDPNFALAYVGLAECYGTQNTPATEAEAEDAARRALALDDTLAEAHASLGFVEMFQHWDWAGAEAELRRAIELNPNDATAHQWYATRLELERRFPEAERELQKALEIDPLSLPVNADLCELKFFERDYDSAITQCQKTLEFDQTFVNARLTLTEVYMQKGLEGAPLDEYFKFRNITAPVQKDDPELRAYNEGGVRGFLRRQLEGALRVGEQGQGSEFVARRYVQLGDKEEALRRLNAAYERHTFMLPFINAVPAYDGLRSDPRFADIVRRVGLPQP